MRYFGLLVIAFLFTSIQLSANESQNGKTTIIKGQLVDLNSSDLVSEGFVIIDNQKVNINKDGRFTVVTSKDNNLQILINIFGYREIKVINLPTDKDTINLGQLPVYRSTLVLVNYGCRIWNPICKYRIRRNAKGLDRHSKAERKEINKRISKYVYIFEGKRHPIQCNKRFDLLLIDLK